MRMHGQDATIINMAGYNGEPPTWFSIWAVTITAVIFSTCSMLFCASFGALIGTSLFWKIVFSIGLASINIVEFLSGMLIRQGIIHKDVTSILIGVFVLMGGVAISIISGQSAIQQNVSELEQERIEGSDIYKNALAKRREAEDEVKNLFISQKEVAAARKELSDLTTDRQTFLASPARNRSDNRAGFSIAEVVSTAICSIPVKQTDSYYKGKYCGIYNDFLEKEKLLNGKIKQGIEYQEARNYLETLRDQPLPTAITDTNLPGLISLAMVLGVTVRYAGIYTFLFLAVFWEIGAVVLWIERAILVRRYWIYIQLEETYIHNRLPITPPVVSQKQTQLSLPSPSVLIEKVKADLESGQLKNLSLSALEEQYGKMLINEEVANQIKREVVLGLQKSD